MHIIIFASPLENAAAVIVGWCQVRKPFFEISRNSEKSVIGNGYVIKFQLWISHNDSDLQCFVIAVERRAF